MHYADPHSGDPIIHGVYRKTPSQRVVSEVVPKVPSEPWHEAEQAPIFARRSTKREIAKEVKRHRDEDDPLNVVYVLECRKVDNHVKRCYKLLEQSKPRWRGDIEPARRLIYVGVTNHLPRRLNEHLNSPDDRERLPYDGPEPESEAADFTTVFPPVRLLNVSWWSRYSEARTAEKLAAHALHEAFPKDCIFFDGQPLIGESKDGSGEDRLNTPHRGISTSETTHEESEEKKRKVLWDAWKVEG